MGEFESKFREGQKENSGNEVQDVEEDNLSQQVLSSVFLPLSALGSKFAESSNVSVDGSDNSEKSIDEQDVVKVHENFISHASHGEEDDCAEPLNDME